MNFRKSNLIIGAIFALTSVYYTLPYFLNLQNWGIRDWDLFTTITAVPLGTIANYGQFPFWNPYILGGNILFHHPEVAVLSPFILLHALFGVIIGLKLQVLICYFLGFWGSYRFARSLQMSRAGSALMSLAYFGSIHFALHFAEGHVPFTHFCFLPWFLFFVKESLGRSRRVIIASVVLALMILGNGAAVPLLYTGLFSLLFFSSLAVEKGEWRYLRNLTVAGAGGLLLAAIKALPMIIYLIQNKWSGNPEESIPVTALGKIFFGFEHSLFVRNFPEQIWAWHEYGAYISPALILLAAAALVLSFKRSRLWLVLALFFFALGLGDFGRLSPWTLLTELPGFSSARCTGRSFQFVILTGAILGGLGFDLLREKFAGLKWVSYAHVAAAGVVVLTNLILVWPVASEAFTREPQYVIRSEVFEQVVEGSQNAYRNYLENKGSLVAPVLSAYHPTRGLVSQTGKVMTEFVQSGEAKVLFRRYTPNRIEYTLDVTQPGLMMIGMGFDEGWSVIDGRKIESRDGLIAVPLEAGPDMFILEYRTPYIFHGAIISLLSLVAAIVVYRKLSPARP